MKRFEIQIHTPEIEAFLKNAKGDILLHISDTATDCYPVLKQLLEKVKPACIIHTGDSADEFKVGRKEEDRPGYEAGLRDLIRILRGANCPAVFTPGNNDDFAMFRGEDFITVAPNGTVDTFCGISCQLDHFPIFGPRQVDFAMYGHSGNFDLNYPIVDAPEGTIYLNGMFHWTLIDTATKEFLRIPSRRPLRIMRIFVARHGQVSSGEFLNDDPDLPKADPPISPVGISQAELLAQEMKRLNFRGKIYASPFRRALMTAQPTAQLLGLPIYPSMPLREIMKVKDFLKDFKGMTLEQMKEQFPQVAEDAVLPYPWWNAELLESRADVADRVEPFLEALLEKNEDVLLIGHSASNYAVISYLMRKARKEFSGDVPPRLNCALSQFRYAGKKMTPVTIHDVSFLPASIVTENTKTALVPAKKKENWYLTQTHLHAGFENFASIRSHAAQAKRLGYDALFITEHDVRMNRMAGCIEAYRLKALPENPREGWYLPDGSLAEYVPDGEGYSLRLKDGEEASFQSEGKRHQASLLADLSVTLRVNLPENASMLVDFTLSQRPDDLTQQHLVYGIGEAKAAGWFKTVQRQEQGVYTFRLSEDALWFDPAFGLDNAFLSVTVKAFGGDVLVKALETERKKVAQDVRKRQAALAKSISEAYGIQVYSGFEVSVGHHRNCFSAHVPVNNYENTGYELTEDEVAAYLRSYNATFSYNHMFQPWKRDKTTDHEDVIRRVIENGEKTRFGGAQLLEVGFPATKCGFTIQEHLRVWDALAMKGVPLVGYGDSDSHNSARGWIDGNRFGSWILAPKNSQYMLEQAMRKGRVCLGDPVRWKGGWEFTVGDGQIGDRIAAEEAEVNVRLWDMTEPVVLRLVCGGKAQETVALQQAQWCGAFRVARGALSCCPVRLEICDEEGNYLFLTNPVYLTDK